MWTDPKGDLRVLLSDGPTDKLRAFKTVFGAQNESNVIFKTFEFRRITDFTASGTAPPFGVYLNNVALSASAIASDSPETGYFFLDSSVVVGNNAQLLTTYYIQWFLDSELEVFLIQSSKWLGQAEDYTITPDGLQAAALKFAAHEAYLKLSLKYAENVMIETYRVQDEDDKKRMDIVGAYQVAAKQALAEAKQYRDDFYKRKGKPLSPISGTIVGRIQNPTIG